MAVQNKQVDSNKFYRKSKHTFTCDGLDIENKIAYEFNGCYYHGCPKCFSNRKCAYDKTMAREKLLIDAGLKVESIWECDWQTLKKTLPNRSTLEKEAKDQK